MNKQCDSDRSDKPAVAPILDPREARARHRCRTQPSAGLVYLRALSRQEREWMARMARKVAREFNVDAEDLLQDLQLGLLGCNSIDGGRRAVRSWLTKRARWRAAEIRRADRSHRERTRSLDEVPGLEPPATDPVGVDLDWSVDRLQCWGLNRDEAQVVLLVVWA